MPHFPPPRPAGRLRWQAGTPQAASADASSGVRSIWDTIKGVLQ